MGRECALKPYKQMECWPGGATCGLRWRPVGPVGVEARVALAEEEEEVEVKVGERASASSWPGREPLMVASRWLVFLFLPTQS